jgi:hypothetical protein
VVVAVAVAVVTTDQMVEVELLFLNTQIHEQ